MKAIRSCWYWAVGGVRDARRGRGVTMISVTVILGAYAAFLGATALERQVIDEIRSNIEQNPSSLLLQLFRTPSTSAPAFEATDEPTVDGATGLVPVIKSAVVIRRGDKQVSVTLSATKPGDPYLLFHDIELPRHGPPALVVNDQLAKLLDVGAGDEVAIELMRSGQAETQEVAVPIAAMFTSSGDRPLAFADVALLDAIESWKRGTSVPKLGLVGRPETIEPAWQRYISFCRTEYNADDVARLRGRGLTAERLDRESPDGWAWRRLAGLLRPVDDLVVYSLTAQLKTPSVTGQTLQIGCGELERGTINDDVIVAWNDPIELELNGLGHTVVGLTVQPRWLRPYFRLFTKRFTEDHDDVVVNLTFGAETIDEPSVLLTYEDAVGEIPLAAIAMPEAERIVPEFVGPMVEQVVHWTDRTATTASRYLPKFMTPKEGWLTKPILASSAFQRLGEMEGHLLRLPASPLAVVSAAQLSRLARWQAGELTYDDLLNRLVSQRSVNHYHHAVVWARSIDTVPELTEHYRGEGFEVISAADQVTEMRAVRDQIMVLARVLMASVAVFVGVLLGLINWQSTLQNRRDIGVQRLLGTPAVGIIVGEATRSLVLWIFASALMVMVCFGLQMVTVATNQALVPWTAVPTVSAAALGICLLAAGCSAAHSALCVGPADALAGAGLE